MLHGKLRATSAGMSTADAPPFATRSQSPTTLNACCLVQQVHASAALGLVLCVHAPHASSPRQPSTHCLVGVVPIHGVRLDAVHSQVLRPKLVDQEPLVEAPAILPLPPLIPACSPCDRGTVSTAEQRSRRRVVCHCGSCRLQGCCCRRLEQWLAAAKWACLSRYLLLSLP